MKKKLDELVKKYETKEFIKNDPSFSIHLYKKKEDIEIAGFLASLLAYGKREAFMEKLKLIFSLMPKGPHEFVLNYSHHQECFDGFVYRFVKDADLKSVFLVLNKLYSEGLSLEELFSIGTQNVCDYFYSNAAQNAGMGFYHLIPNPEKGGAQKRFNMYLRWMIRKGPVDSGVWSFMDKSKLLIPLDVHVGRVSRSLSLLERKSNDFRAVVELTNKLREFDSEDPVKYDFALFGAGINRAIEKF